MTKYEVIDLFLEDKKAVDFYGINAPESITVTVNGSGDVVTFKKMFNDFFLGDELETSVCYQSEIKNNNDEYPVIEIVVKKCGKKRISYKFNLDRFFGCRAW